MFQAVAVNAGRFSLNAALHSRNDWKGFPLLQRGGLMLQQALYCHQMELEVDWLH